MAESTLKMSHTILAVDDEPANLRMLERLLRKKFSILKAASGEEALQILEKSQVSMIMTDQRMPGISGIELLTKSKALQPDVVRMVVTGNTDSETTIQAIRTAGAVRVIIKPWDPDQVMEMVSSALEKYEVMMENKLAITNMRRAMAELDKVSK
jgi:response regulator RpfG family c-di-GMP phosphodiesterase